jgi:hypothetical protein
MGFPSQSPRRTSAFIKHDHPDAPDSCNDICTCCGFYGLPNVGPVLVPVNLGFPQNAPESPPAVRAPQIPDVKRRRRANNRHSFIGSLRIRTLKHVQASIKSMIYGRALRIMEVQRVRRNKLFIFSKGCRLPYSMIRILKRPLLVSSIRQRSAPDFRKSRHKLELCWCTSSK